MELGKLLKATLAITAAGAALLTTTSCKKDAAQNDAAQHAAHVEPADRGAGFPTATVMTTPTDAGAAPVVPPGERQPTATVPPVDATNARVIPMQVTAQGYEPREVQVKQGEPIILRITRTTERTCATEILIDGTDLNVPLPLNQPVDVAFTPDRSGEIKFGCAMDKMISGVLTVEPA